MKILVSGASGLLGSELIPHLTRHSEVFALGRRAVPNTRSLPPVDLGTDWSASALPAEIDVVIHLAQSPRYRDFPDGAREVSSVNLQSTAILLDYARAAKAKRFILASTGGVYRPSERPLVESSALLSPKDLGHYAATKLASEMLASSYSTLMDVHVLRIFFMYGPRQQPLMFMPSLITRVRDGVPITLRGREGMRLNPVHVSDVAKFTDLLTRQGGPPVINVAGPEVVTILELAGRIGSRLGRRPLFENLQAGGDLVAETVRMRQLLVEPLTSIEVGLNEMTACLIG